MGGAVRGWPWELTGDLAVHGGRQTGQRGGKLEEHVIGHVTARAHLRLLKLQRAGIIRVTNKTDMESGPDACRTERSHQDILINFHTRGKVWLQC